MVLAIFVHAVCVTVPDITALANGVQDCLVVAPLAHANENLFFSEFERKLRIFALLELDYKVL